MNTSTKNVPLLTRLLFALLLLALLSWPATSVLAFSSIITLDAKQIQARVNKAFPIEFGNPELRITFYQPKVMLSNEKNQISLKTYAKIVSNEEELENSTIKFAGKPYYFAPKGEFRLRDLWLQSFKTQSLTSTQELQLTLLVNLALVNVLTDIPIYTLDESKLREKIAKKRLKSAKVVAGKLELEFSLD